MITEELRSATMTERTAPALADALNFLRKADFSKMDVGPKYPIGEYGDRMFVLMNEYETQPKAERKPEQHRGYIDIHYMVSGSEMIGVCFDNADNVVSQPYSTDNDCTLYAEVKNESDVRIGQGCFAVCFPTDIHRPGGMDKAPQRIKKAVVKIDVDLL